MKQEEHGENNVHSAYKWIGLVVLGWVLEMKTHKSDRDFELFWGLTLPEFIIFAPGCSFRRQHMRVLGSSLFICRSFYISTAVTIRKEEHTVHWSTRYSMFSVDNEVASI